jgi:opacity protein-like surface antigen
MRKTTILLLLLSPLLSICQNDMDGNKQKHKMGIGLKAGVNFANVTHASNINSSNKAGFMAGAFLAPPTGGVMGYRSEIIFSRQGYDFKTNTKTGSVNLDYILLPQLTSINLGKFASLLFGAQMAFLINAKADSTNSQGTNNPYAGVMNYYNKFDYGAAAGVEIFPFKGLLIGLRYNISFGKTYKDPSSFNGMPPSFFPTVDAKSNVVQLFAGYKF